MEILDDSTRTLLAGQTQTLSPGMWNAGFHVSLEGEK